MNIKSKTKPLLITITLMSTSLFGSDPTRGKLPVLQEKQQDVSQTITEEEVFPPILKTVFNLFNLSPEVKTIQKTYFLKYKEWSEGRNNYEKKIAKTGCGNYSFKTSRFITREDFFKQAQDQYLEKGVELFKKQADIFLSSFVIKHDSWWVPVITKPYLLYSFFDLIGFKSNLDLFKIFQEEALYNINLEKELFIATLCNFLLYENFYFDDNKQTATFREMFIYLLNKYADVYNVQDLKECLAKYFKAREAVIESDKILKKIQNGLETFQKKQNELNEKEKEQSILATKEEESKNLETLEKKIFDLREELEFISSELQTLMLSHPKEVLVQKIEDCQSAAYNLFEKIKEQVLPKKRTLKKSKTQQQTQPILLGRKAIPNTFSIPEIQKQMRQIPTPKTLKDLDDKFGEDLAKQLDELEIITIDFESEKDWNGFVKENNVEISGTPYQHGSHESQEIFFYFEGQRTKGQLLTYHGHGRDTAEKITRQIRITRRVQK